MNRTLLASAVGMALMGAGAANAALIKDIVGYGPWSTDSANFTLLSGTGATLGGTNDVSLVWDGDAYNSSSDYTGPGGPANITASTPTLLFGRHWTLHDIQVFVGGSYSFDTSLGGGNPESGAMNVLVGGNQLGIHMLFDWGSNFNIDVFVVTDLSSVFGAGIGRSVAGVTASSVNKCDAGVIQNCLWDGATLGPDGKPAGNKVWMLASVDGNGDGVMGIPMATGGPFGGLNANLNTDLRLAPVPIPLPSAAWLLGSGLPGLLGLARKRKRPA